MSGSSKKPISIRAAVAEFLARHKPQRIGSGEMAALREWVRTRRGRAASRETLLDALFETEIEVAWEVGGLPADLRDVVRTREPDLAASSLKEMSVRYGSARQAGQDDRMRACRRAVMRGKQRLRRSLARPNLSDEKRREKQEILEWFLVWLEAPELFPDWIELRGAAVREAGEGASLQ